MGSSSTKEPEKGSASSEKKAAPPPVKKVFALTSEQEADLLAAHAAMLKKQDGAPDPERVVSGVLQREFRLPAELATWLAPPKQGVSAADFVAFATRCADPDGRRALLFEAYSEEGNLSCEQLRCLLEGSLAVAVALAQDFGGLQIGDLKGKTEPGGVVEHLAGRISSEGPITLDGG